MGFHFGPGALATIVIRELHLTKDRSFLRRRKYISPGKLHAMKAVRPNSYFFGERLGMAIQVNKYSVAACQRKNGGLRPI